MRYAPLLAVLLGCLSAGCAHERHTRSSSALAIEDQQQIEENAHNALELLDSGSIQSGMELSRLLEDCTPCRIDFANQFALIQFYPVPNLHGLTLIAVNGKVVSAIRWTDVNSHVYFDTLTDDERKIADELIELRLF